MAEKLGGGRIAHSPNGRVAAAMELTPSGSRPIASGASSPTRSRPDPMPAINAAASGLEPVALQELGAAALMDRFDTKFLLPSSEVAGLLLDCGDRYRVLEVNGNRLSAYRTRYFDTADLRLYHAHHAGRVPRFKVRVRSYLDTEMNFLEVKRKTNKGRTVKVRVLLDGQRSDPLARLQQECFFGIPRAMDPALLGETLIVDYSRMTLVSRDAPERITIDLMLTFSLEGEVKSLPSVAIAEVKREGHGGSPFRDALKALNLRPGAMSKYCMGIATLDGRARTNNFKQGLRRLEKIENDHLVLLKT